MLEALPGNVRIIEVGPRDGLQNEKTLVSTQDKYEYIKLLSQAGLKDIEATSFVRSEKIPQMQDASELFTLLKNDKSLSHNHFPVLIPNLKGLEFAISAGVKEIAVFTSNSNTFNSKNINATIDESLIKIEQVCLKAREHNLKIRGYVSTVFGCPYEGKTSIVEAIKIAHKLLDLGVYEVSLGDTIGVANPKQVSEVIKSFKDEIDLSKLAMHFHDTRGMAVANIQKSLELGITNFDASSAGLGGCPYAKGASGNVATEDVIYLMHAMGIKTGVDMDKLSIASEFILSKIGRASASKSLVAYLASKK